MNLYVVAYWQGDGELDEIYLVRALGYREAASFVDLLKRKDRKCHANWVCLVGRDCSESAEPALLLGPVRMLAGLAGYGDYWCRQQAETEWISAADYRAE